MGCFLVVDQQERFVLIPPLVQPFERMLGSDVSDISLKALALTVDQKIGVVILALSRQHHGMVKTLRKPIQVDLPYHGRGITCLLKQFGKIILIPIKGLYIVHLAIDKTVLACQYYRPAWGANGVGNGGSGKDCPFLCQPVNVWRFIKAMPIGADGLIGM